MMEDDNLRDNNNEYSDSEQIIPVKKARVTKSKTKLHKWSEEEVEKLIDIYEERPCLWDTFKKEYSKRDIRDGNFQEIEEGQQIPVAEIKSKVNRMRAQLGRELNIVSRKQWLCSVCGVIYISLYRIEEAVVM